eukprot:6472631-Amphidinium_carterae.3
MAGSNRKVVRILPTDRSTGGVESSRFRHPTQAVAEGLEVSQGPSASAALGGTSPLISLWGPKLAVSQSTLPGTDCVEIKGDLRVSLDPSFKSQLKLRSSPELRPFA